jgi:hypothetical protein
VSTEVKLAGRLPQSAESNGMYSVQPELLTDPEEQRLAVIWYDVLKITRDVDQGDEVPTIRVLKIEPMGQVDDASQALREMVMQKAEARLGHTPLPFDQHDPDGVALLPSGDEEGDD